MYNLIVQLRYKLLVCLTHNMALPLMKIIRSPQKFSPTKPMLHLLPEGMLGKELVTMLDKRILNCCLTMPNTILTTSCCNTKLRMKEKFVCNVLCWVTGTCLFL